MKQTAAIVIFTISVLALLASCAVWGTLLPFWLVMMFDSPQAADDTRVHVLFWTLEFLFVAGPFLGFGGVLWAKKLWGETTGWPAVIPAVIGGVALALFGAGAWWFFWG